MLTFRSSPAILTNPNLNLYKMARTRANDGAGTSQGGGDAPNPPPVSPTLADAIVALVTATTDNARLLREVT
jgi:hypothetical protein